MELSICWTDDEHDVPCCPACACSHGTCAHTDQLTYFMAVYTASARVNPYAALVSDHITPSNTKPYTKGQVRHLGCMGASGSTLRDDCTLVF